MKDRRVLPEELIEREISININRGDRDGLLWLAAEQYVRAEHDGVTDTHWLAPELAEHNR